MRTPWCKPLAPRSYLSAPELQGTGHHIKMKIPPSQRMQKDDEAKGYRSSLLMGDYFLNLCLLFVFLIYFSKSGLAQVLHFCDFIILLALIVLHSFRTHSINLTPHSISPNYLTLPYFSYTLLSFYDIIMHIIFIPKIYHFITFITPHLGSNIFLFLCTYLFRFQNHPT